jgi:Ca2+-binding RTX toxin-like protein
MAMRRVWRRRHRASAALVSVIALGLTPSPAEAGGGGACSFAGGTVSISMSSGESGTIVRSGAAIEFNGAPCDTATVSNTDLIAVSSPDGFDTFTVDLSGGPFAPGATDEGNGSSEIEITVDRDAHISILGSDQADHIAIDDFEYITGLIHTADLNADESVRDDDISAGHSSDYSLIDTGAGNDTLEMTHTEAHVLGGDGADVFQIADVGDIQVDGGPGSDMASYAANPSPILLASNGSLLHVETTLSVGQSLTSIERAEATRLNDEIHVFGGAAVDALAGSDRIFAYKGSTTVTGGADHDSLVFHLSAVKVLLEDGIGRNDGTHTHFRGVEAITGTPGNDTFVPAGRDYQLKGGDGLDTYSLANAVHGVRVDLDTGDASNGDRVHAFEAVIGSPFADRILGADVRNILAGRGGNDVIRGLDAGDQLLGGEGDDLLNGGPGHDECHGGPGTDTLVSC